MIAPRGISDSVCDDPIHAQFRRQLQHERRAPSRFPDRGPDARDRCLHRRASPSAGESRPRGSRGESRQRPDAAHRAGECTRRSLTVEAAHGKRLNRRILAVAMQIRPVALEPGLCRIRVRTDLTQEAPVARRVIHLDEMGDLVGGKVIQHLCRSHDQPPRE